MVSVKRVDTKTLDVTAEEASNVMDTIIGMDVLQDDAGNSASVVESCELVSTTTKPMY